METGINRDEVIDKLGDVIEAIENEQLRFLTPEGHDRTTEINDALKAGTADGNLSKVTQVLAEIGCTPLICEGSDAAFAQLVSQWLCGTGEMLVALRNPSHRLSAVKD